MRLVTYESNKRSTPQSGSADKKWPAGVIVDERIVDATTAAIAAEIKFQGDWISNREIIQLNPAEQSQFERAVLDIADAPPSKLDVFPIAEAELGPPIPDPDKIICLGLNYRSHVQETGLATYQVPILFAKYRNTLTGPASPILLPPLSEQIDYEGELAVVIGKRCKHVPPHEALDCVGGYMVLNDVSARDLQFRTGQWLSGKTLDTFAPCGPALVVNEIQDPQSLDIRTRVNGQILQQGNTRDMIFPIAETIAYVSQLLTLEAGDIIATGTPDGVGFKRNPPIFLRHGDIVEVEIEGIGTLRNPVTRSHSQA